MSKLITKQQAHTMLKDAVTNAGGCTRWAERTGISISYTCMLLTGERPITATIAGHLGLALADQYFIKVKP